MADSSSLPDGPTVALLAGTANPNLPHPDLAQDLICALLGFLPFVSPTPSRCCSTPFTFTSVGCVHVGDNSHFGGWGYSLRYCYALGADLLLADYKEHLLQIKPVFDATFGGKGQRQLSKNI